MSRVSHEPRRLGVDGMLYLAVDFFGSGGTWGAARVATPGTWSDRLLMGVHKEISDSARDIDADAAFPGTVGRRGDEGTVRMAPSDLFDCSS